MLTLFFPYHHIYYWICWMKLNFQCHKQKIRSWTFQTAVFKRLYHRSLQCFLITEFKWESQLSIIIFIIFCPVSCFAGEVEGWGVRNPDSWFLHILIWHMVTTIPNMWLCASLQTLQITCLTLYLHFKLPGTLQHFTTGCPFSSYCSDDILIPKSF